MSVYSMLMNELLVSSTSDYFIFGRYVLFLYTHTHFISGISHEHVPNELHVVLLQAMFKLLKTCTFS
jgi:hypothetical protein